jgi:AcrR family transcriptional regulator
LTKIESSQKWIEAGYELFSLEGPEGIHVEKMARQLGLNKSGFYHYFGERDIFFSMLIDHHRRVNDSFANEISHLDSFDPDFLKLVIKYKTAVLFQGQLRKNHNNPLFRETFFKVKKLNEKIMIPLWTSHLKLKDNIQLSTDLWDIFRDVFFIRISNTNFNYESVKTVVYEFTQVVDVLLRYETSLGSFRHHRNPGSNAK